MMQDERNDPVSSEGGNEAIGPARAWVSSARTSSSARLMRAVWNVQANGGQTVEVQQDVVAHGQYAVKFHALPNIVSYDFIITKSAPAGLRGHHFGRAYFQVTPKPPQLHTEFCSPEYPGSPI